MPSPYDSMNAALQQHMQSQAYNNMLSGLAGNALGNLGQQLGNYYPTMQMGPYVEPPPPVRLRCSYCGVKADPVARRCDCCGAPL